MQFYLCRSPTWVACKKTIKGKMLMYLNVKLAGNQRSPKHFPSHNNFPTLPLTLTLTPVLCFSFITRDDWKQKLTTNKPSFFPESGRLVL